MRLGRFLDVFGLFFGCGRGLGGVLLCLLKMY